MTPEQRAEDAEAKLPVDAELLDRLIERTGAWGERPNEWLTRAVDHALSERPEPLPLPPLELPLLTYGALQPGELAHQQIAALVLRAVDASVEERVIRTRDGLPLLVAGSGRALGTLLWFTDSKTAYDTVRVFEPSRQYRWATVGVLAADPLSSRLAPAGLIVGSVLTVLPDAGRVPPRHDGRRALHSSCVWSRVVAGRTHPPTRSVDALR